MSDGQVLDRRAEGLDPALEQAAGMVEGVQRVGHPGAAHLDAGDLDVREPAEEVAEDEGEHRLEDPAVAVEGVPPA